MTSCPTSSRCCTSPPCSTCSTAYSSSCAKATTIAVPCCWATSTGSSRCWSHDGREQGIGNRESQEPARRRCDRRAGPAPLPVDASPVLAHDGDGRGPPEQGKHL